MTTALLAMAVAAAPLAIVGGLLRLTARVQRRREVRCARQIELTDAIHREMGAAAAPVVERTWGGGWLVRMMVPLDSPAVVAAIVGVTSRVFAFSSAQDRLQILLTAQPASRAVVAALRPVRRPAHCTASMTAAAR
jgi:hypothetical protein